MTCDASWPWDACKIDRSPIDLWDDPQSSRRKSGVGYPSGDLAEWTHTSAEPSTVQPFSRGRGRNERSLPVTSIPSWAGETTAVVWRAEVAVVRPRQDPLGWDAERSAAGDHAPV